MTVYQYSAEEFVNLEQKIADFCRETESGENLEKTFEEYQNALDKFSAIDGDY